MKGEITQNVGDGLYRVEIIYDTELLDKQIEALEERRIEIVQEILDAQIQVLEKQEYVDILADDIDEMIRLFKQFEF